MTSVVPDVNAGNTKSGSQEEPGCLGGFEVDKFAAAHGVKLFWATVILGGIVVLSILLMMFGYVHIGKTTTSTYTSSFTPKGIVGGIRQSNFGNSPNWYMQDGCAGYNCSVDTASGRSLGFGMSKFDPKKSGFGPLPGTRQHMVPSNEAQQRAAAELLKKSNMDAQRQEHLWTPPQRPPVGPVGPTLPGQVGPRRERMTTEEAKAQEEAARAYMVARNLDEVGARQARVIAGCDNAWDPMASEEAKVLGAVGVFKANTPGMSSFSRAINDNIPLTDAQLEAIMQGGEPYTISPAGIQDVDALAAQQRQEQSMAPARKFV